MKKFIFTLSLLLLFVLVGTTVFADGNNITPVIVVNSNQVAEGGDLSATLKIESLDLPGGIADIVLTLSYEDNIFEAIDSTSIDALNNWKATYDPLSRELTLTREENQGNQEQPGDVVKIDFRVKTGTNGNQTNISFKNMTFANAVVPPINSEDISTSTITIGEVQSIQPVEPIEPTPNEGGDLNPIIDKEQPDPEVPDEKPDEIPETGLSDSLTYIILGMAVVSAGFYINYKKFNKKNIRYVNVE